MVHFSTSDQKRIVSDMVWDTQILHNRSQNARVNPRWRPNRPLDPQDGRPDEPRAFQTAFQTVQEPILEVSGPSKPRFWPPGTHFASNVEVPSVILDAQRPIFQPPGTHFAAQTSLCPSPTRLHVFPSLVKPFQAKPPSLQASKPPRPRRDSRSVNNFVNMLRILLRDGLQTQKMHLGG